MFKKAICSILVSLIMLFMVTPITALAVPPVINNPCYQYVDSIVTDFDIDGSIAYCYGSARTNHSDTTTTIRVTLQKRGFGSTIWTSVKSWTNTANGQYSAVVNETKEVSSGYNYRLYVWVTIKDSDGNVLEGVPMYSQII